MHDGDHKHAGGVRTIVECEIEPSYERTSQARHRRIGGKALGGDADALECRENVVDECFAEPLALRLMPPGRLA